MSEQDEQPIGRQVLINQPLPEDLHTELKARAARERIPLKVLIPRLLKQAMESQPKEYAGAGR